MNRRHFIGLLAAVIVGPKPVLQPDKPWTVVRPTLDHFVERAEFNWYEIHSGLVITWTELKQDGITIY